MYDTQTVDETQGKSENSQLLATLIKNSRECFEIHLSEYHQIPAVDIRVYWTDDGEHFWPSKRGISIRLERFWQFKRLLDEVFERLEARGLLPEPEEEDELEAG